MILAHVLGIPVEESVPQLAPVAAAVATTVVVGARVSLVRLRRRLRR